MLLSTNGRASIVTRKANGVAGRWRDVRAGCQGRGHLRGQGVECSVTALFIQRLNSLRGEAGKCQHGEDDYEEYRSSPLPWKEKAPSPSSQPAAPALPAASSDRCWERRGRNTLSHSFIPFSRCCWFMLAVHLLYINTDKAHQRAFEGFSCPDGTAEEIMSAVSITKINEWK